MATKEELINGIKNYTAIYWNSIRPVGYFDVSGADFSYLNINGKNLSDGDFTNCNFRRCSLQTVSFEDADLTNTNFHHADLTGYSSMSNATLSDTYIQGANITNMYRVGIDIPNDCLYKTIIDD